MLMSIYLYPVFRGGNATSNCHIEAVFCLKYVTTYAIKIPSNAFLFYVKKRKIPRLLNCFDIPSTILSVCKIKPRSVYYTMHI